MPHRAQTLSQADPELWKAISGENARQETHIELIASENYASQAVMAAQGSQLTNKYAEGYPGKRYYGGCEFVDVAERLAIDRVKKLFDAEYANVQPHSGAQANQAVFFAALQPGDTMLGMSLPHGGHLTHGSPVNLSRQVVQRRCLRARPGYRADRLRRRRASRPPAQAEADHRRRVGLLARHRLEALPRHRRLGRRATDGRHGALRWARGRRRVSQSGRHRALRHQHDAQDAARTARRVHPRRRRAREARSIPRCFPACRAAR